MILVGKLTHQIPDRRKVAQTLTDEQVDHGAPGVFYLELVLQVRISRCRSEKLTGRWLEFV